MIELIGIVVALFILIFGGCMLVGYLIRIFNELTALSQENIELKQELKKVRLKNWELKIGNVPDGDF